MSDVCIPAPLVPVRGPGHCDDDAAWAEFVRQYDGQPRSQPDLTDFALANRVFMADRNDLDLIVWQTAAKQRIRWLSIELAKAKAALSATPKGPRENVDLDLYDPKVQLAISWALGQVGAQLGAEDWAGGDGSESVEGDVGNEIGNIMRAAGLVDGQGEPLHKETYAAAVKVRDAALEEAATICEDITSWGLSPTKAEVAKSTQTFCAKAIRAQKSEGPL